ncbi:MAG: glycosyltransferase [Planctomycetaceae bacterium]|nr:glycosyltransferase [Planctomycetaceae bacterium]
MRIAVLDHLSPGTIGKDPVQIALGLQELGCDALFISMREVPDLPPLALPIVQLDTGDPDFWVSLQLDAVLFISRFAPGTEAICRQIKSAGIRLVLKADSDGTLGYPLVPNYLRTLDFLSSPLMTLVRNIKWRLPVRHFVAGKLDQTDLADHIIFECPRSVNNVRQVMRYWKYDSALSRLHCIPNPVAASVFDHQVEPLRERKILAVGRWEDELVKNTRAMCGAVRQFAELQPDCQIELVGSGDDRLRHYLREMPPSVTVTGPLPQEEVFQRMKSARSLLMPSRMESFGLAAAEALCLGCSIIVTPVESLDYLSAAGQTGSCAAGFRAGEILAAMLQDFERWDSGFYDPAAIAAGWRDTLSRSRIARQILELAAA